jgi:hypothetical protein
MRQSDASTGRTAAGSGFRTHRSCRTKCRAVPKSLAPAIFFNYDINLHEIKWELYVLLEGSVDEMLVHEMRSCEQRFKVVVTDPQGNRQSNGGPKRVPAKIYWYQGCLRYFCVFYLPPTQSQKANMLLSSMPNSITLVRLVDRATKCSATFDG